MDVPPVICDEHDIEMWRDELRSEYYCPVESCIRTFEDGELHRILQASEIFIPEIRVI